MFKPVKPMIDINYIRKPLISISNKLFTKLILNSQYLKTQFSNIRTFKKLH